MGNDKIMRILYSIKARAVYFKARLKADMMARQTGKRHYLMPDPSGTFPVIVIDTARLRKCKYPWRRSKKLTLNEMSAACFYMTAVHSSKDKSACLRSIGVKRKKQAFIKHYINFKYNKRNGRG